MGYRIFLIPCQAICFASVVLEEKDEFNPKIVKWRWSESARWCINANDAGGARSGTGYTMLYSSAHLEKLGEEGKNNPEA